MFRIAVESMINVPKVAGSFFIKWRILQDGKIAGKGRTTNSVVKNFKINWNETIKLEEIQKRPPSSITIEFTACELEDGEAVKIGSGRLTFHTTEHGEKPEAWTILLEESKLNAGIKLRTWFGDQSPEDLGVVEGDTESLAEAAQQKGRQSVASQQGDEASDYSCASDEYRENKRIIDEIFSG